MTNDKKEGDKMMEYSKYKKTPFCTAFSDNADHAFGFA